MSPFVKYTLGRVGLFVGIALLLWPVPVDLLVKLMIALIASFGLQFVVLRKWRVEMINQVDKSVAERRAAKEQLRSALAGDDTEEH
ncbi:MAG: hypothetical protein V7603_4918 [Micromonosporaceae bacterium]